MRDSFELCFLGSVQTPIGEFGVGSEAARDGTGAGAGAGDGSARGKRSFKHCF